jgi:hypothetical protein
MAALALDWTRDDFGARLIEELLLTSRWSPPKQSRKSPQPGSAVGPRRMKLRAVPFVGGVKIDFVVAESHRVSQSSVLYSEAQRFVER